MSRTNQPDPSRLSSIEISAGSLRAPRFFVLLLVLTGCAVVVDQLTAPLLYSSSPLWAIAACLLLVWRRGQFEPDPEDQSIPHSLSWILLLAFLALHAALIVAARSFQAALQPAAGTVSRSGSLLAVGKLSVLIPPILLLPVSQWKRIWLVYRAETTAALVALFTFFPGRAIEALWPWYGQALGRFVFALSRVLARGIGYVGNLNPTLTGPDLNVTIILACSGMNGIELFDYLFGFMAVLDWNRLQKRRLLAGYFLGLAAMLLGNALRITSLVVLGNRGFAETVARYHISAGWIFFSFVFLVYLSLTYRWMLKKRKENPPPKSVGELTSTLSP